MDFRIFGSLQVLEDGGAEIERWSQAVTIVSSG
jgi:hypothetical protein